MAINHIYIFGIMLICCVHCVILEEYAIPDNIDIDDILKSDRLLTNYINCLLEIGRCTPDGDKLRRTIPEALQNDCEKCNEKIKINIKKVIKHISENKPKSWKELLDKYDPTGEYKRRNQKLAEDSGIKI